MRTRTGWLLLGWTGLLLGPGGALAATDLEGVRYWTAPDHTRIVLDLSRASSYEHSTRTGPPRIVIEIPGARLSKAVGDVEVSDGLVDRIRTLELPSGAVQVVLDLTGDPAYKTFVLEKIPGQKQNRIVVDVLRPASREEKAALERRVSEIKKQRKAIVVIDPGHGGEDPGAVAPSGVLEKDLVLQVAKEVQAILKDDPGVELFLSRKSDYSVSLARRQEIAREVDADLFVSVHANSARVRSAHGAEVFFLSMKGASDAAALEMAEMENAADLVEGGSAGTRGDIEAILCDLNREAALRRSSRLAEMVHEELGRAGLTEMRRVKQAGFQVLRTIQMPAVLVELGFLSNAEDRRDLCKASHRKKLAEALAHAIREYVEHFPPGEAVVHVVGRGESLWNIARQHGITVSQLRDLNHLGESDRILIGQRLLVR
jgi:N-acetylmuramoyl-L-alanine amidase